MVEICISDDARIHSLNLEIDYLSMRFGWEVWAADSCI